MLKRVTFLTLLLTLLASQSIAEQKESGFYGNFELGGGYISNSPAGDEVTDKNKKISSVHRDMKDDSESVLHISGELGYFNSESDTDMNIGAGEDGLYIGVTQGVETFGNIGIELGYNSGEVWKDPYVTNRHKTDMESKTINLTFSELFETGALLSVGYGEIDVKSDKVTHKDLKRDGKVSTLGAGYSFEIAEENYLTPVISFARYSMDGDSQSRDELGLSVESDIMFGKLGLNTKLELAQSEFDKSHPVFNKKRKDTDFTLAETVSYFAPFDIEPLYLFLSAGYSKRNSNIKFYDSDGIFIFSGVGVYF